MTRLLVLATTLMLAMSTIAYAGPAMPDSIDLQQPDGTTFKGKVHGDEFQNWIESTESGHTVVKNPATQHWEYAEQLPDGSLKASGVKVEPGGKFAPSFLPKGVKPVRDTAGEKRQKDHLKRKLQQRLPAGSISLDGASGTETLAGIVYGAAGDWTPVPVAGTKKLLIVLVNFANRTLVTTPDAWYNEVFDTTPGAKSVANFYKDNSFGTLTVAPAFTGGTHPGVVSVTIPDSHPNSGNSYNYTLETTVIGHALAQAVSAVDLSAFDPSNDEVFLIYAGYENSGSSKTPKIWAHAWSGSIPMGSKTITGWALCGELNNSDQQHPVGVIVHELGHLMTGLPDLYDTTNFNAGLGNFSVMAGGSWGTLPNQAVGSTPVAMDAWSREFLGWTTPVAPSTGSVTIPSALSANDSALKLARPERPTEYWLAENRPPTGWDAGITGLTSGYAGGLLITHIDLTVGTRGANDINAYHSGSHQGVVPAQASTVGCNMLTSGCRGSATTTYYSGNNSAFTPGSVVSSAYYDGTASNFSVTNISARGTSMTADLKTSSALSVASFAMKADVNSLTIPVTAFAGAGDNKITGYKITTTSTAPLASATGWLAAPPTAVVATGATSGSYTFYAWVKDSLNNVSSPASATVSIDLAKPVVGTFTVPAQYGSLTVPVSIAASDNSSVTGYLVTETATVPLAGASTWLASAPTSYTVGSAGAKTLYAWAKDAAGNVSVAKSAPCVVDVTKPVVSAFTLPTTVVKSLTVTIPTFTATDNVKVAGYQVTESSSAPSPSTGWSSTAPKTYTFASNTADGVKTLYAWAVDTVGNVSLAKSAAVAIDTTAPAISAFTVPALSASATVRISSFTASDNGTITGYAITATNTAPTAWSATKPVSFIVTGVGSKTLYAWVKDAAGNVSASASATVNVDLTKPVVGTFTVPAQYGSLSVPVTVAASDDNSGVAGYLITETGTVPAASAAWLSSAPTSYTVSAAGAKTLYAWAKDAAGNVSVLKSAPCIVDLTKPVVSVFTLPSTPVKSLTVPITTYTATDNVKVTGFQITESSTAPSASTGWSATAPKSYTFASNTADGVKTLYAWALDSSGNVSLAKSAAVTIDTTAASISAFTVPAVSASLTIPISSFTASDNVGIAGYAITTSNTAPTTWSATKPVSALVSGSGSKTLYAWVKDTAGNVSASTSATVNVDTTKPVVSSFSAPAQSATRTVAVTFAGTDDNSGVKAYLITENSTAPTASASGWSTTVPTSFTLSTTGTKAMYAWVKDAAGNISVSKSVLVKVLP